MARPLSISREDLKHWADRYDAPGKLPVLVRRLLLATTPLSAIDMRGDGGTRLGGWDGEVMARRETAFCPLGLSVWELSVDGKVKKKLDDDFDTRTKKPNLPAGIDSTRVTYVAVTARSFDKKKAWAKEKKAKGRWADVRVYDADDLATWLQQAPAVGMWFGTSELNRPVLAPIDVESWLHAWSQRTRPPLPWSLVLLGSERERVAQNLREWLGTPGGGERLLQGENVDEALLFACAVLAKDSEVGGHLSRTVIVHDIEALRWAIAESPLQPLLVIPSFELKDTGEFSGALKTNQTKLLVPANPTAAANALELPRISRRLLLEALTKAGWSRAEANRLVEQSNGSLRHLQALCGYSVLSHEWRDYPRPELFALVMAGEWTPTQEADRAALRNLGGDPDQIDALCVELQKRGKIERVEDGWQPAFWKWHSPKITWQQLGSSLTDSDLHRFSTTTIDVLSALDPMYDLPKGERMYATLKGAVVPHSGALRRGLVTSLIMLAMSTQSQKAQKAVDILYRVLPPERGWKAWASVAPVLPLLAEVSPEDFLRLLEKSLEMKEEGVCRLLGEESTSGSGDPTPHVDLLWALEALAWSPDPPTVERVAMVCARLAVHDKNGSAPGKVATRPWANLTQMLDVVSPQSRSTAAERLGIVKRFFRDNDEEIRSLGWNLSLRMIGVIARGFFALNVRQPQYRWDPVDSSRAASDEEQRRQSAGAVDLLLAHVGISVPRWVDLLDNILIILPEEASKVLDALETVREDIVDTKDHIRHALRERMQRWNWHPEHIRNSGLLEKLRELYRVFTPLDPVRKHAWLFTFKAEQLSHTEGTGWQLEEGGKPLDELRVDAVNELYEAPNRWDLLAAFSQAVDIPFFIGEALASSHHAAEVEEHLLAEFPTGMQTGVLQRFFSARHEAMPEARADGWMRGVLEKLISDNRYGDAEAVVLSMRSNVRVWDLVENLGEPLISNYWKRTDGPYGNHSAETFERAIRKQLDVGNVLGAFDTLSRAESRASSSLTIEVLERLQDAIPEDAAESAHRAYGYRLETILDRLDERDDVKPNVVLKFELAFSRYISDPKRMRRVISTLLAENPKVFVQLIEALYRPEGEPPPDDTSTPEEIARAGENVDHWISSWNGYPGETMPTAAEREEKLEAWAAEVLDACAANGRRGRAANRVAEVLARAPHGADGHWPCFAARKLLGQNKYAALADGLRIAQYNRRGVTTRDTGEGGTQERELALSYMNSAAELQSEFPETATMLRDLARDFERDAEPWDARARRFRIEYGDESPNVSKSAATEQPHRSGLNHIHRIHVENLRCFDSLTINIDDIADKTRGQCLILLGLNGTGKTTLLRAIAAALLDEQVAGGGIAQIPKSYLLLRNPDQVGQIELTLADGEKFGAEFVRQGEGLVVRELYKTVRPWVVGYGCFRGSVLGQRGYTAGRAGNTATLWGEGTGLWSSLQTLKDIGKNAKSGDIPARILADGTSNALKQVLHGIDEVSVESDRLLLGGKGVGGKHPAEALSDGYLGTMAWVLDMIMRWCERMEALELPLSVDFLEKMEGVALVDDIDLHLHPKWQREILKNLKNTFPRMTFIGTTHNPLALVGLRPNRDEILGLEMNEETGRVERVDMKRGRKHEPDPRLMTGTEIYRAYFGIESFYPQDLGKWLRDHRYLAADPTRSDEDEKSLDDLEAKLRAEGVEPDFPREPREPT